MKSIYEIDKNFKVETKIDKSDIKFYNVLSEPFHVYGVFYENGKFRRMPEETARSVSSGVYELHANTAGGRVRFRTNATYIAINAKMPFARKMPHFAVCGSAGFDLYEKDQYVGSFIPPFGIENGYEKVIELGNAKMREITINFPLYSDVSELYIGVNDGALICEPTAYKIEKPIVYYGSSITQGGCASRPGSCYTAIVSRKLNTDHINLGFSGSAKGEEAMAKYIKSLDMTAFVYDYDHNAPTVEHLRDTHERMFLQIREANPELPIIMMSRPKYCVNSDTASRLEVIRKTYENAISKGDKNVYLIDGRTLMRVAKNEGTVDSVHPTDLGFFSMATALLKVFKNII